eukprot:gb/GFBE01004948.1/.p1 GENE.gb/GFBE01004948.1/~~gb/GFBE01004948.1/.p1  ORF type:complete len:591 (+),score=105.59 gb/GFBE01004948.1/:1-1773(+)
MADDHPGVATSVARCSENHDVVLDPQLGDVEGQVDGECSDRARGDSVPATRSDGELSGSQHALPDALGEIGQASAGCWIWIAHVWRFAAVWLAVVAYLTAAFLNDAQRATAPAVVALLLFLAHVWSAFSRWSGKDLDSALVTPSSLWMDRHPWAVRVGMWLLAATILAAWIAFILKDDWQRLIPAAGLLLLIGFLWVFSAHRSHVTWRPIIWGVGMQIFLGILIMRTRAGFLAFEHLGQLVKGFLDFSNEGSRFVFGEDLPETAQIAFKVLPVIIYFSSLVSVAYHVGLLQAIFLRVGWLMQRTMGTAHAESLVAAANIFIGQTEAPLLVKPFLAHLTRSEIHAVMSCGFATIAGGVMAAYISQGVPPDHLIAASVMSCPAALAMAKVSYPETETSRTNGDTSSAEMKALCADGHSNVLDAMSSGVSTGISMAVNVGGNLIAFIAVMAFLNSSLTYAGSLVGIEGLTFQVVFSYVLWPLAFLMGVKPDDCGAVGLLIGEKTFINEFVAYKHLVDMKSRGEISAHSAVIATYALCGFSNFGSIGVQIGGLSAIAPSRKQDFAELALRSMITGTMACFMTACVAGMLVQWDG